MIRWNSGLALGIKQIDDDHKKLLTIINKLSELPGKGDSKVTAEEIMDELENYVKIHFQREEKIFQKLNCSISKEHVDGHANFFNELSDIRKKVLNGNEEDRKEIVNYLTNWLIHHIVDEDMKHIQALQQCNVEKSSNSIVKKIFNNIKGRLSFSKRMQLVTFIPLITMLLFASAIIVDYVKEYRNAQFVLQTSYMMYDINALIHALQKERGLSCAYLSDHEGKFVKELAKVRGDVDKMKKIFLQYDSVLFVDKELSLPLKQLSAMRKEIDARTIESDDVIDYYNRVIQKALEKIGTIAQLIQNNKIRKNIESFRYLLYFQNVLGLQRAYGVIIIEKEVMTKELLKKFLEFKGEGKVFLDFFYNMVGEHYSKELRSILSNYESQTSEIENKFLYDPREKIEAKKWFDLMTSYIDDVKGFSNKVLSEMIKKEQKYVSYITNRIVLMSVGILLILGVTFLIVQISQKSLKKQLEEILNAMKSLAMGRKDVRLKMDESDIEMLHLVQAYENIRRELIKSEIITQIYEHEQKLKIQQANKRNEELETIAYKDPLTMLVNRRKFFELAENEFRRSKRYNLPMSLMMLDIDHFKKVNDTYGHAGGDVVLKTFADICREEVREIDIVARLGGEEFVILLPQTKVEGAFILAERLRKKVEARTVFSEEKEIRITVSIGIASYNRSKDKSIEVLIRKADEALYLAKASGRNRVVVFDDRSAI